MDSGSNKMKKASKNTGLSLEVAGFEQISNFIDDYYRVVNLHKILANL
jgi:hypothetical protein